MPWVAPLLYGAVLLAGGYAGLAGLGETRPALFLGGLAALFGLDFAERRRYPVGTPIGPAVALLLARLGLFLVVAAADGSGLSRVLFLLLPFTAYFAFGRTASIAIGAGCLGLVAAGFQLTEPGWHREAERVADLLMLGIGVILTIAMAAVAVEERQGRARLAELSAAAERNRLARDIHDGLGHHLTAIIVLLEKATAFWDREPATGQQAVADAHRSARKALDEVRRSVRALHAEAEPFRLSAALDELVREAGAGRPAVKLHCAGDEAGLDQAAQLALYRAAQEGITNARRHSGAGEISVSLRIEPKQARLTVADDGCGFAPDRAGFGLLGMRERVRLGRRVDRGGQWTGAGHQVDRHHPEGPMRIRVLVADDQRLIRESIASLLDIQPGIEVVGTAEDGRDAVDKVLALHPDVVLMDVRMPMMDGLDAVVELHRQAPDCKVVMLTTFDDEEYVVRALRAGACGYLLKDRPAAELADAVRMAHAGVVQLDPAAAARVATVLDRPRLPPVVDQAGQPLTNRELEVLRLLAAGATNREIAAQLFLSEGTVKNHVSRILARLGLRDRTQAAIYARDRGLA